MKNAVTLILLSLLGFAIANAYNIKGTVVDETQAPMPKATVRVLTQKDSTAVKGAITNENGRFDISDVAKGTYILETTYVGYSPVYQNIELKQNLNVGTIKLAENAQVLKDLTVTGIKTPIKVMEDTVEFNADSYKTQPNAVVEDLLKRLPGVEVDSEGKITHNGKEITKILVDGKEFFSDDPKVASKNLPVNMVEKLQVIDRKSDLARMTGVDDGEDETVINLSVKPGMKNGWFGTVEGGYGTDERYKASFNVNRFWNGNQITFIGGANNVNDLNFTDGGANRFQRFGGSNGITTSRAFGINFNVGKDEIFRVGGDVMYSHSKRDTRTELSRQYLFTDSTSYYDSKKNTLDKGDNLRADFRIQWNPDSFNTLEVRPNFSLNYSNSWSDEVSENYAGIVNSDLRGRQVNKSINEMTSKGHSFEFGTRIIYNHNFKQHRGRSFSIMANIRTSNVREKTNTYSWNQFYLLNDSIDLYDQFANNHTWSNTFSSRITWTEPLGDVKKGNFLTFAYQFQYRWNNADKLTYDHPVTFPDGWEGTPIISDEEVLDEDLSNRFRNNYMNQDIRVGYKHVSKTQNVDVGLSLVPQMSKSTDLINDAKSIPTRWVWNYAPYMRYRWKMSNTRSMHIDYNGRSSQPSMTQLQPVADMSNPLNIVQGNPDLKPSFTHNLMGRFQDFQPEAQRAIMAMLRASMTQNSIVSRTTFNSETGGQYTTYENVNGVFNINGFAMISFPFRNKAFTFNNHIGLGYNQQVGYVNGSKNKTGNFNLNESFGVAWRPDNIELELRPQYSLQTTHSTAQSSNNRTVHSFGGRFTGTYYTPFGLVLNTDLNYSANRGYGEGYNKNEWMWNATISYQFLRDRSLTLSVTAQDLLQQRSNIQRNITNNYIQDAIYNSLTRYFMVTVSYKFNTFGQGNEPESRNRRRWGGPGGGPGGPPPGGGPR
ncbi:MAG: outer membrane beta-barrel protein [Bacteroidales bacterium]|nr:outer membrane beta-barrel protein [Bacteroidales bacterium]